MPERLSLPPSRSEDLPEPSVELTMIGALMRAHLSCLPPKKRRAFLKNLMVVFEEYEACSNVVRLRSKDRDSDVALSRRKAVAWTRAMMAVFWTLDMDRPE